MPERWETMNQIARPLDEAMGFGLDMLRKVGLYDPMKSKIYSLVRANMRRQFDNDHDLEIVGLENVPETGGALLACNHQSWLDVQVMVASNERRVHFVAKDMFEEWPFLRHLIELSESLYIRRGGDAAGLKAVADALRDGRLVGIFPEGTIPGEEDVPRWNVERDTGLLPGKSGVVRLALMAGVPVIPVGVSGTGAAFPPEAYPRMEVLPARRKGVPITIRFGKPIKFEGNLDELDRDDLRNMTKKVMRAISGLVDHDRNYVPLSVPVKRKTKPERTPRFALRSEPRKKKGKAPVGVLVVHGFTSHIDCVAPVEQLLKDRKVPYRFPILRGHGGKPEDMVGTTAKDWYADAEDALLDLLGECKKVVVVGHSMGGLVSLDLAAHYQDRVQGVVVAAPALKFADPASGLTPVLAKVVGFWPSPNAYEDKELKARNNKNYERFATDAFLSLYRYAGQVTNVLSFVKAPTVILQSKKDTVVAPKAADVAYEKISSKDKRVVWFEKSGHEMFLDLEADAIVSEVGRALDSMI